MSTRQTGFRAFLTPLIASGFVAALCCFPAASEARESSFLPMGLTLGTEADLIALGDKRWLVASADGLSLLSGNTMSHLHDGQFESLDTRPDVVADGHRYDLIAAIDADQGRVTLFRLDTSGGPLEKVRDIEFEHAIPESLCLFRDPATAHITLFTLDARGTLQQRYIYDATNASFVDVPVRSDVGVPDAEACAVDDRSRSLFIADEPLGVRRLNASEESDPIAEPWLLIEPFGRLSGEVKDIAVDGDGTLWVLVPDSGRVYRKSRDTELQHYSLPEALDPASLAVGHVAEGHAVAVFDEAGGDVWTLVAGAEKDVSVPLIPPSSRRAMIAASGETAPVRRYGDAADDPAIIATAASLHEPLILGTDKREGLAVYRLSGALRQLLPVGRVNNVDVVSDVPMGDAVRTIAAASNRSTQGISLFTLNDGAVEYLDDFPTGLDDVYGLCLYHSDSGLYVFINDTNGAYEQYRVEWAADAPTLERVRRFTLPSQPEGCATDTKTGKIYMGEEAEGVWMAGAEPGGHAPELVITVSDALVADVEGMDIYRRDDKALLVVSSQGSNSFAVFDLNADYRLVAHFEVRADIEAGLDGVSETDGLAVSAQPLPGYPEGILVVQDGRNRMPDEPQNFKIIDWRDVQRLLDQF